MKKLLLSAAAVALLAGGLAPAYAADNSPAAASDLAIAPRMGTWGFDLAGRDTSVTPGADFFNYANGAYMKTMVIPPDRSRYGSFDALTALSENRVHAVLESAAANAGATGSEALIGQYYKSFMDEARVEALDAKPLAGDLAAIRAANTRAKLATLMGQANMGFYNTFFVVYSSADAKAPNRYAIYTDQAGLGPTATTT